MNDSGRTLSPDRLPWLDDEPKSRPWRARVALLSVAVLIVPVAVGYYYSPWIKAISAADNQIARAPSLPDVDQRSAAPQLAELPGSAPASIAPETLVLPATAEPAVVAAPGAPIPAATPARLQAASQGEAAPVAPPAAPLVAQSGSAGSDCRFAKTQGALAVCRNPRLATLDREHALLYSQALRQADAAKRGLLQRARQRFFGHLNACSTDACATGIYLASMRELGGIATAKVALSTRSPAKAATKAEQPKPSFSCRVARTQGELAVCGDARLAALDRHQALLYSQSWGRADAAKRARLLRAHERLVSRRNECETNSCTNGVYIAAMSEVTDIMKQ